MNNFVNTSFMNGVYIPGTSVKRIRTTVTDTVKMLHFSDMGGSYKASEIKDKKVYKISGVAAAKEKLSLTFEDTLDIKKGQDIHFSLIYKMTDSANSYYANNASLNNQIKYDYHFTAKENYIKTSEEVDNTADFVLALAGAINSHKEFKARQDVVATVEGLVLTLEVGSHYARMSELTLCVDGVEHPATLATVVAGYNGFGTYEQLAKNVQLPTGARTHYLAVGEDERLIPGALYNMYYFDTVVDKGVVGLVASGATIQARGTVIIYVKNDIPVADVDAVITSAGMTVVTETTPTA